jgi:hypothetical protein|tara:strand:+ start:107 stop:298 length:192 start_codon:yes stop_codon:yes gene_type:complete
LKEKHISRKIQKKLTEEAIKSIIKSGGCLKMAVLLDCENNYNTQPDYSEGQNLGDLKNIKGKK